MKRFWDRSLTNPRWWAAVPLVILLMAYSLVMLIPALIADVLVIVALVIQHILHTSSLLCVRALVKIGEWTYGNLKD